MVKLRCKVEDLEPINPKITSAISRTVDLTSLDLLGNLKRNSPVDHGRLQGSWVIFQTGKYEKEIKSSANYAIFVNDGTGLYGHLRHKIYPKNGRYLSFVYDGRRIAVPWTRGQKPKKFVEKSMNQTKNRINEFLIRAFMEV